MCESFHARLASGHSVHSRTSARFICSLGIRLLTGRAVSSCIIAKSLNEYRSVSRSLSAVSGAPRQVAVPGCAVLEGALLIQRLEGSRPPGSLCTLNRSEQVQRDQAQNELGSVGRLKGRMEQRVGSPRPYVDAGEVGMRGVLAGRDKGSACAPKHGQRPRM